jgi:ketosteroid isomerase-like protein
MSQENVEIIRRLLEAFNLQDAQVVADLWMTDGEWRPAYIGGGLLEGAVFRGREGMVEFVELQSETWESVLAEPGEMRDLGETVLVEVHLSAVGRGSGVPVERVTWNVFELLDGKAAVGTVYTTKEQALKAVGLPRGA